MAETGGDDIRLRLGLKGADDFLNAMKEIEKQSDRALKQMAQDGRKASSEFEALDRQTDDLRKGIKQLENAQSDLSKTSSNLVGRLDDMGIGFQDLQTRMGPVGQLLAGISPRALLAAGGIAAVGAAVFGFMRAMDGAAERVTAYASDARRAGFTVEDYRALELQFIRSGQSFDAFTDKAAQFAARLADASNGQGELHTKLKDTHPDLLRQLLATENQAEALFILGRALAEEENEIERNRLAMAALGDTGIQLQDTLITLSDEGIDSVRDAAREAGVALTDGMIEAFRELQATNEELSLQLDTQLSVALALASDNFSEVKMSAAELIAVLNDYSAAAGGSYALVSDAGLQRLRDELAAEVDEAQTLMEFARENSLRTWFGPRRDGTESADERLSNVDAEIDRRRGGITNAERRQSRLPGASDWGLGGMFGDALGNIPGVLREDERERTRAARERVRMEQEAARILAEQGDITQMLAMATGDIERLKAAGLLSDEQAARAISEIRAELEQMTPEYVAQTLEKQKQEESHQSLLRAMMQEKELLAEALELERDRAEAVADLQARHARDMAIVSGDRDALRAQEIDDRTADYMRAGLGDKEARRRAEAEVEALESAEVVGSVRDTFGRGMVEAFSGGDVWAVFSDALSDAARDGLYEAATDWFDLIVEFFSTQDFSSIFGGGSGGFDLGSIFDFGGWGNVPIPGLPPKYHTGSNGLGPDEYMATLRRGEKVTSGNGGAQNVFSLSIDARGADEAGLKRVETRLATVESVFARFQGDMPQVVKSIMYDTRANEGF